MTISHDCEISFSTGLIRCIGMSASIVVLLEGTRASTIHIDLSSFHGDLVLAIHVDIHREMNIYINRFWKILILQILLVLNLFKNCILPDVSLSLPGS